ncbi:MAG: 50S ribosomal protein L15 [Desulfobacterales bacterium]|jgi:large subunit ribosomal protein L15|nr:50S ribosomal protein L15 [Desulfobacterales bacterium]
MKLNEIAPEKGANRGRKRLGRGVGSGAGKTAARGTKGQKSRSGGGVRPGFEGGQMPIHRRLPKRGFTNIFKKNIITINIRDLLKFESGSRIDSAALMAAGLVKGQFDGIKLLGQGEIDFPVTIQVNQVSKNAGQKITAAGGSVEEI